MGDVSYTPGTWVGVAGPSIWLLAEVDSAETVVQRLWTVVGAGASVDDVLATIVHEGFRTVGNFAIVTGERVVVRGHAGVELRNVSGQTRRVSAVDVATWLDVPMDNGPAEVRITGGGTGSGVRLPLGNGVVLAAEICIGFGREFVEEAQVDPPEPVQPPPPVVDDPVEQADYEYLLRETRHAPAIEAAATPPTRQPIPVGTNTIVAATEFDDSGVLLNIDFDNPGTPAASPSADAPMMTVKRQSPKRVDQLTVLAIRCPGGHLNPDNAFDCRVCGTAIAEQEAREVPRPVLGTLRLSTGSSIPLERGVILGREPQSPTGEERLWNRFMLPSPGNDISRNHLEVRIDGWQVMVTDLNSTNGSTVTVPGMASWPLQPGESVAIEPGTVVSLADEISFTFEVTG